MTNSFNVSVFAAGDRNKIIWDCKECILNHHGSILDFKSFSDLSLNLLVEMKASELVTTIKHLANFDWTVEYKPSLDDLSAMNETLLNGTIQVTFSSGEGKLKDIVPAIPG